MKVTIVERGINFHWFIVLTIIWVHC